MELHYWEKQLILYTKGHFDRVDYEKDLKHFPSELYGLGLERTDNYNVLGMVTRLYQNLVDAGHIKFTLEKFISDIFKRATWERNSGDVTHDDILHQLLAEFQCLTVFENGVRVIDLGTADEELKGIIQEAIENDHGSDQ